MEQPTAETVALVVPRKFVPAVPGRHLLQPLRQPIGDDGPICPRPLSVEYPVCDVLNQAIFVLEFRVDRIQDLVRSRAAGPGEGVKHDRQAIGYLHRRLAFVVRLLDLSDATADQLVAQLYDLVMVAALDQPFQLAFQSGVVGRMSLAVPVIAPADLRRHGAQVPAGLVHQPTHIAFCEGNAFLELCPQLGKPLHQCTDQLDQFSVALGFNVPADLLVPFGAGSAFAVVSWSSSSSSMSGRV